MQHKSLQKYACRSLHQTGERVFRHPNAFESNPRPVIENVISKIKERLQRNAKRFQVADQVKK
jgi:hypothetical protein